MAEVSVFYEEKAYENPELLKLTFDTYRNTLIARLTRGMSPEEAELVRRRVIKDL